VIAGRYSLEREIGRGGMGAVWLGIDAVLEREVALKRIGVLPGADSTDLARAEREARLAARLDHPNVVAVFNLVVDADSDSRWLVMEYVDGTNLSRLVRERGPLSPDEAAPLLRQTADALAAAHAAGIVHRDVKPSNILVDRGGRAKLTDFGIARIASDPSLTQTGLVTGSPAYLPPEVASGERGDEAVDVWALGATIFYVLSGRTPYEMGDNVMGGLYRIVHDEPPRLGGAGWLAPLLEATMVKDPSRRWSMAQVRDFLAAGPSGHVRPPTRVLPTAAPPDEEATETRSLAAVGPAAPPDTAAPQAPGPGRRRRTREIVALVGFAVAVVLALVLFAVLPDDGSKPDNVADGSASSPRPTPAASRTASPSRTPAKEEPTVRGMESFIRDYVAAVASDPDRAWPMLTPKFQRESGGLDTYRKFWSGVGRGKILAISADPRNLVVSYRVRFDHFGTGRRPTVLDLAFDDGTYRIDGEHTEGFVPAG
jgi:eukaryotic-like serine/threonine-protein kinase